MELIWLNLFLLLSSIAFILGQENNPGISGDSSENVDIANILALEDFGNLTTGGDNDHEGSGEDTFEIPEDIGEPVDELNSTNSR